MLGVNATAHMGIKGIIRDKGIIGFRVVGFTGITRDRFEQLFFFLLLLIPMQWLQIPNNIFRGTSNPTIVIDSTGKTGLYRRRGLRVPE